MIISKHAVEGLTAPMCLHVSILDLVNKGDYPIVVTSCMQIAYSSRSEGYSDNGDLHPPTFTFGGRNVQFKHSMWSGIIRRLEAVGILLSDLLVVFAQATAG